MVLKGKRKNVFGAVAAGILGFGLLTAWLATGENGLSEENRQIYEQAIAMQEQIDTLGFRDFRLADYPVAMYDGKKDYVFNQGKIRERAPVMETFVGTAYPVEDHFEVLIPTIEQFDKLLSLAGGVEGMVTGSGYGPEEQEATIWHEAFHAYQLTYYAILGEKVTAEEMRMNLEESSQNGRVTKKQDEKGKMDTEKEETEDISEEAWIVREVDQKGEIRGKIETELKLLEDAAKLAVQMEMEDGEDWLEQPVQTEMMAQEDTMDALKEVLSDYSELRRQRLENMPEEAAEAEIRCELTEGTAYYVESKVYEMLAGKDAYEEQYLDRIGVFEGGRGKYYRTGMAKCLILDKLSPEWKDTFDFSKGLDEVLFRIHPCEW